ncbi:MAG: hypothetical protein FGM32_02530 [Candidatus Kapabacteria bacterium]|nr:hypothetical protein [Candidatus Kapabacteria bacterium]
MKPNLRRLLATISGLAAGILVIAALEMFGHALFMNGAPMPSATDPAAVQAYAEGMSFGALATLLVAWCAGAYVGTVVAVRVARGAERTMSLLIGGFVLASTVMNFFQFPHPMWLMISAIVLIPVASWLAIPRRSAGAA